MKKDCKKPCNDCAFRRSSVPGKLGGSPVETYIGQTIGPFYIPCHLHYDSSGENWKQNAMNAPQCAGSQVFRANAFPNLGHPASIKSLPADHENVFSTPAEFISHHTGRPVEECELTFDQMAEMFHVQASKPEVLIKKSGD